MALRPLYERPSQKPVGLGQVLGGRTRWKLLGIIIAIFFLVRLIEVVREPKAWHWFYRMNGLPIEEEPTATKVPNSKLPIKPIESLPAGVFVSQAEGPIIKPADEPAADVKEESSSENGAATSAAANETPSPDATVDATSDATDLFPRVWREAWRDIYDHLQFHQRGAVYRALKAGRDGTEMDEVYIPRLQEALSRLDLAWTAYQAEATAALMTVPDDEKPLWLDLLRRAGSKWGTEVQPALTKIADKQRLAIAEQKEIADLQDLLDSILLREIEDDTVWRASETEISFRLFEIVKAQGSKPPEPPPTQASYVQLFKQSPDYRGKWVQVKGVAKQAWHVRSQKNWVGIDGYYVFVLKPLDVNSPLIVYALELPPGFGPVKDKDLDGGTTELNDEMEFTGLFLKRWAYVGQDGTYTAPLVIANSAKWTPPEKSFAGFGESTMQWMPHVVSWVLTTLFLTAGVIWYFRPRRARIVELPEDVGEELRDVQQQSVQEKLRQLEDENPRTL